MSGLCVAACLSFALLLLFYSLSNNLSHHFRGLLKRRSLSSSVYSGRLEVLFWFKIVFHFPPSLSALRLSLYLA